jgi:hypothetical protein
MTVVQVYLGDKHWKNVENPMKAKEIIIPAKTKEVILEGISVNSSYSSKLLVNINFESCLIKKKRVWLFFYLASTRKRSVSKTSWK